MGRPKQTGKGDEIEMREKLLAGAIELFNRKGYEGTTVREIVSAAGVTKPVLYYYFKNKEGIYLALMETSFSEFIRLFSRARKKGGSAKKRIVELLESIFSLFIQKIDVARIIYSIYYGPPQGAPSFDFNPNNAFKTGTPI